MQMSSLKSLWPAKLTASALVIKETDTVQLSCENPEDLKMEMCHFNIKGRESNSEQSSSCQLSLTGSQISIWSEGQSSSVRITCFYTAKLSEVLVASLDSDPVTITIQTSTGQTLTTATKTTSTATSTGENLTAKTTSVPPTDHIHSEGSWLLVVLVFTGIGLFLSGLMGFICLCHSASSDDVLTEVIYSSCHVETTSLLTSSVCSAKHG